MIKTVHLIHHTHTDFGYTDLPSTSWRYHVDYCRQALALAWESRERNDNERWRWTFEVLWPLQRYVQQMDAQERSRVIELLEAGQIDAGGMPFNTTALLTREEWRVLRDDFADVYDLFKPTTCMQVDINGLPWGLMTELLDAGMRYVLMSPNPYSAGPRPAAVPSAFWWEGPDGRRMLTWLGHVYSSGTMFFHETDWRRGPVPPCHDVWFDTPDVTQLFRTDRQSLTAAHQRLQTRLADLKDYQGSVLPIQVTNAWRADNDPPMPHLADFVAAWNHAGLQPHLTMSTPTRFFGALEQELPDDLPVRRGDWSDWWADVVVQVPRSTALAQRAKELLTSMPAAAGLLQSDDAGWRSTASSAWHQASLHTEHTFGSYDSVARPYGKRTTGHHLASAGYGYEADEAASCAAAQIIRGSARYRSAHAADAVLVANPSAQPVSNWVTISAQGLRKPWNAVIDPRSGQELRFETEHGPEWSDVSFAKRSDRGWPDDVWSSLPVAHRFFVRDVPPGQTLVMPLVEANEAEPTADDSDGTIDGLSWTWDERTGELASLEFNCRALIDVAEHPFGTVLFEQPHGFTGRRGMISHDPKRRRPPISHIPARLRSCRPVASWYGRVFERELEHPLCRHITQQMRFLPGGRLELTTVLAVKESEQPYAALLCLPFNLVDGAIQYDSLGWPTTVGADQLPGTCGEYAIVGHGVQLVAPQRWIGVGCLDTPLVSFDHPHARNGQIAFTPTSGAVFPHLIATYWDTNVPIAKADEVTSRHVIAVSDTDPEATRPTLLQSELWAMPTAI